MRRAAPLALVLVGACLPARYLPQAVRGQAELVLGSRPIPVALRDPSTSEQHRDLLADIEAIKRFAVEQGLRATDNYARYVDVGRPAVAWVVSAAPPLSLELVRWDVPVVGPFPYLGWFSEEAALAHAADLRADGLDTDVRPVAAYSTLGFLRDPVLSTMLADGPGQLANTVLHESVHATLHVAGAGAFNEGLATHVADALTPRFLALRHGEDSPEVRAYADRERDGRRRVARMHRAARELQAIYRSALPDDEKLARKWRLLAALREEMGTRRTPTNASMAQFLLYRSDDEVFGALRTACGGSVPRLLAWLRAEAPARLRGARTTEEALAPLRTRDCPP